MRRWWKNVVVGAVVVLTGASAVAASEVGRRQPAQRVTAGSTTPTTHTSAPTSDPALPSSTNPTRPSGVTVAPAAAPAPPSAPTRAAAKAAPTAAASSPPAEAPTTTTTIPSRYGPASPDTAVVPYEPGQTSWSGTSNGIALRVRMEPPAPRAGQSVRFVLEVTTSELPCCVVGFSFGDGSDAPRPPGYSCPSGGPKEPGTHTVDATHVYNKGGRWEFLMSAGAGNCQTRTAVGNIRGFLDVGAGPSTGQGPSLPTIRVTPYGPTEHYGDNQYVSVGAPARDEDGYLTGYLVDYGDGSPTERYPGDPMGCRRTDGGWPAASNAYLPIDPPPTHKYAARGVYRVTVTVFSAACDGSEVQQASGSFEWGW